MKRKRNKQWFSMLMATAMVMSSISVPVMAAPVDDAMVQAALAEAGVEASEGREINFNNGWKFHFGDETGAEAKNYDDSKADEWGDLNLPHDFSITQEPSNSNEAESGFMPGGTGWYRKRFTLPSDYAGKSVVLNFDGSYNHTYVYVNGTKVGENHYGYNDFAFDISDYLTCDGKTENVISVKVVHQTPSSRWYSGSGIYRDVELIVTDAVHVSRNGTYVTTPNLATEKDGDVTVNVKTKVQNDGNAQAAAQIRTTVLDAEGNAVSAPVTTDVTLAADATEQKEQTLKVNKPALWSTDAPNLYYVQTEVLVGGEVKDTYKTTFGFRYINFDSNTGFSLNGENVKLQGVCMHHDQGALGAASYRDAVYRQVEKLKEMGCNAIRTSHNTPSSVLLEACNELGMMVMDETFDGWAFPKNGNSQDFSTHFNQTISADNKLLGATTGDSWYKFVLESNIDRDKNDPSVIIWDIGNELNFGVTDSSQYEQYAKNMKSYIEAIDKTRPITVGDNNPGGLANANTTEFRNKVSTVLAKNGEGLAGANYSMGSMSGIHNTHPDWKIIATETASPSNSRGIYNTLSEYRKTGDYQCTAYDTNAVSWGNTARESWWYTVKDDFVSGEFIWTGFDYIGEPTPWNGTGVGSVSGDKLAVPNSSYFGVIDTAGFEKDSFYFYTSQWRKDKQTLHIVPQSWNAEDLTISGGKVPVYIYSNAAKVELYLNGKLIGTSTRNVKTTAAGHEWATYTSEANDSTQCSAVNDSTQWKAQAAQFNVKYAEGTLSAKAYDADGYEITDTLGSASVTTNSDEGTSLAVTAEKTEIQADGSSLSYIDIDVNDKDGRFVSSADNSIRFTLTGNGTIVGVDNGNPSTVDKFQQKSVLTSDKTANIKAFSGKALVIVRSTEGAGGFVLKAESTGLKGDSVFVSTTGDKQGEVFLKDYDIKGDYTVVMGTAPVLETTVEGTLSDGTTANGTITWNNLTEAMYNNPGDYVLEGTLKIGTEEISVSANLHVKPIIRAMKNYSRATVAGLVPALPETVAGVLPDGTTYGEYPVVWDAVSADALANVGDVVTVNGKATVEGRERTVTATVRVAEGVVKDAVNVAPKRKTLTESCGTPADNLQSIVNGTKDVLDNGNERWTNWNDNLLNSSPVITFTWDEVYELASIKAWFFTDTNVDVPKNVAIAVSEDGENFENVEFTHGDYVGNQANELVFKNVQKAKALRFIMTQQDEGKNGHKTGFVGLTELEIWTSTNGYTTNSTATLDTLKVNGTDVTGFESGKVSEAPYEVSVEDANEAVISATANDNASVTVVPNKGNIVKVLVTSEDQNTTNVYQIKMTETGTPVSDTTLASLKAAAEDTAKYEEKYYTADSYASYAEALENVNAILKDKVATESYAQKKLKALQDARRDLEFAPITDAVRADIQAEAEAFDVIVKGDYTEETYNAYKAAVDAAKALLSKDSTTLLEAENALNAVDAAKAGLTTVADEALKASLQAAADKFDTVNANYYTKATYRAYKTAANAAKAVLAKANATKSEMNAALTALNDAEKALKLAPVSDEVKASLQAAVEAATAIDKDDYTKATYDAYKAAVDAANAILGKDGATLKEAEEALRTVREAKAALVFLPMDATLKAELQKAVNDFAAYKDKVADYTEATYNAYKDAVDAAKAVLAKTDATKKEAKEAKAAVDAAKEALTLAPASKELLDQLEIAIDEAAHVVKEHYTEATYNAYKAAANAAEKLLGAGNVTKVDAAKVLADLNAAKAALKEEKATTTEKEPLKTEVNVTVDESKYTGDSLKAYKAALAAANAVLNDANATKAQVEKALKALQAAKAALEEKKNPLTPAETETDEPETPSTDKKPETPSTDKPSTPETPVAVPAVGTVIKYKKATYKVTVSSETAGTVTLVKPDSNKGTSFNVPATIKSEDGKYTFKVTEIANNAFKGNKKLKKVVIGKNVKTIGKNAFSGDSKLKNITIKSTSLKKVGSKAFKGIHAKAKIKVPAKKLKAYQKLLKKKGQKASVKISK